MPPKERVRDFDRKNRDSIYNYGEQTFCTIWESAQMLQLENKKCIFIPVFSKFDQYSDYSTNRWFFVHLARRPKRYVHPFQEALH
jgi:hypothetical protein